MADINYSNPSSLLPSQDLWKQGPLGGLQYYDQSQDYRRSMDMSQSLQNLDLMRKGAEYQDYLAEGPVRQSLRDLNVTKNTTLRGVQGDIADALGAEARATSTTAPSNAQATVFKNNEHKKAAMEERVSNHLSAILKQYGGNAMAAQSAWQGVVPQLERESGEVMPPEYKNMDINRMRMLDQVLTNNREQRRAVLLQNQKDSGAMDRHLVDWMGRIEAARVRGDQTTAAEARLQQMREFIKVRTNQIMRANPNTDPQVAKENAYVEAAQLFFGGNPEGRAQGAITVDTAKTSNKLLGFEKFTATMLPQDPRQRVYGTAYKTPNGQYVRWTPQGSLLLSE